MTDGQTNSDLLTPPEGHMGQSENTIAVYTLTTQVWLNSAHWFRRKKRTGRTDGVVYNSVGIIITNPLHERNT